MSRVKDASTIQILKVVSGLNKSFEGSFLFDFEWNHYHSNVIELYGSLGSSKKKETYRIVGFWNFEEKKYHWYVTNLKVAGEVLYTLYRLRCQIELLFKANKQSMGLDKLPTSEPVIIELLMMAAIGAHFVATGVLEKGAQAIEEKEEDPVEAEEKKLALSYQRAAKVVNQISVDLKNYFLEIVPNLKKKLFDKIKFFSVELYDPNYKKRQTTLARLSFLPHVKPRPPMAGNYSCRSTQLPQNSIECGESSILENVFVG